MGQEDHQMDFEHRIAAAITNGRRKMGYPITIDEAARRAGQVARALPGLFAMDGDGE